MSNEELLFQAANAADQSVKICRGGWDAAHLTPELAAGLVKQARLLHCAAVELDARARGVHEPTPRRD